MPVKKYLTINKIEPTRMDSKKTTKLVNKARIIKKKKFKQQHFYNYLKYLIKI